MATHHRFDEVQLGLIEDIVSVLEEPDAGLMREDGRRLWRRLLHDTVAGLPQETYAVPRQELVSVVRACAARNGALTHLRQVTKLVAPVLDGYLQPLLEEWRAHTVYGTRSWASLREALQEPLLEPSELAELVSLATGGRRVLPPYCMTPWQAFVHLADANSAADLPPAMVLLEHVARRPEFAHCLAEVIGWNDHFARQWGLLHTDDGLLALRSVLETAGRTEHVITAGDAVGIAVGGGPGGSGSASAQPIMQHRPEIRVYIRVTPDQRPQTAGAHTRAPRLQRYHVSACVKYWDSPSLHREPGTDSAAPITRAQLGSCVSGLLSRMAQQWHNRSEPVALEFFLPLELLTEPVEWWDRDPARRFANPLLSTYRVSLHSLERVQRREFHRAWRVRWAHYKAAADRQRARNIVYQCPAEPSLADDLHLGRLDVAVGSDDDVIGLLLCEPPMKKGELGLEELRLALELGVPVLLYHREKGVPDAWRAAVREIPADEGLRGLRRLAQQWKADAASGRPSPHDLLTIRSMGLIWDNPDHLLDGGPSAPATFVGGTE
ncbi:VMAP-C domain-containing protein [Streptomyces diastatochromogenes]|uniref:VMAP-C domain-containing protein n=1 Tax=Streptomyces diastatochromogenes TaxID=42236 RepID=UPI0036A4AE68